MSLMYNANVIEAGRPRLVTEWTENYRTVKHHNFL